MPIKNRPALLNLTLKKERDVDASSPKQSTQKTLAADFDHLSRQIRYEPALHFREDPHAPDYCMMSRMGFFEQHNGFMLNNNGEDVFIHARRERSHCAGVFDGDKFHISLKPQDVPQGFEALSGLLFSEDSPIDQWKITDMARAQPASRISEGAQITLYVKPDAVNSQYTAQGLNRIRCFVERLESRLSEQRIQPGHTPESDIQPLSWQYTSYRNELRSQREGSEMQNQTLGNEPFYRLVTD